jgi:hypothetical protein
MKSQTQEIYDYLKQGHSITASYAANHFRCWRLAARICDLRNAGVQVVTETIKRKSKRTGKTVKFAAYHLGEL